MALTQDEQSVLDITVALWNAYLRLPIEHDSDRPEFLCGVHELQRHILCRPGRRTVNGSAEK